MQKIKKYDSFQVKSTRLLYTCSMIFTIIAVWFIRRLHSDKRMYDCITCYTSNIKPLQEDQIRHESKNLEIVISDTIFQSNFYSSFLLGVWFEGSIFQQLRNYLPHLRTVCFTPIILDKTRSTVNFSLTYIKQEDQIKYHETKVSEPAYPLEIFRKSEQVTLYSSSRE